MGDKANELPKAVILRLVKQAVPDSQISAESKEALGKAAKVWILYLTHFANEITTNNGKSTISGDHVLAALDSIEFKDFLPSLKSALEEHKGQQEKKKSEKAEKKEKASEQDADTEEKPEDD